MVAQEEVKKEEVTEEKVQKEEEATKINVEEDTKEEVPEEEGPKVDKDGWTPEELALLTKGIARYPPGTVNRWKTVAQFVGKE